MNVRIEKLLQTLSPMGAGAMLLHSPENVRYFTGFTGEGWVFVSQGGGVVLTDSRYTEQAQNQACGFRVMELATDKFAVTVADLLNNNGINAIGYEDELLPVAQHRKLADAMPGVKWVGTGAVSVKIRAVKDAAEIACLRTACEITDRVFEYALGIARPGVSETELSAELKYHMAKMHGAQPSFEFIVASGENGSMPHAVASGRKLRSGDMITLDFGAEYGGYHADMTRTFAVGEPSAQMKEIYGIVLEAQRMGAEALGPGVACKAVDAVARDYIRSRGYGDRFGHGLGHGVGLQIHEQPGLGARSDAVLEPGMAVTVEPGIYLPGVGGVRIEDTCLITEKGWESLFVSSKELIIL